MFLSEITKSPPTLFTVRLDRRSPLWGYICFWTLKEEIQLLNVAVAPFHRRKGIGRLLMDFLLDSARQRGVPRVFLEVRPSNTAALALYRSLGFKVLYSRPFYYPPDGEKAWVMEWQA